MQKGEEEEEINVGVERRRIRMKEEVRFSFCTLK